MSTSNVVGRSICAVDERIAALERELAELSSEDDEPAEAPAPREKVLRKSPPAEDAAHTEEARQVPPEALAQVLAGAFAAAPAADEPVQA